MTDQIQHWFGLLGGGLAWLIHLLSTSVVGESVCVLDGSVFVFLGMSSGGWLLIGISIAALGVAIYSTRISWKDRNDIRESIRFMGKTGVISNSIFISVILAQSIPIFVLLNGC